MFCIQIKEQPRFRTAKPGRGLWHIPKANQNTMKVLVGEAALDALAPVAEVPRMPAGVALELLEHPHGLASRHVTITEGVCDAPHELPDPAGKRGADGLDLGELVAPIATHLLGGLALQVGAERLLVDPVLLGGSGNGCVTVRYLTCGGHDLPAGLRLLDLRHARTNLARQKVDALGNLLLVQVLGEEKSDHVIGIGLSRRLGTTDVGLVGVGDEIRLVADTNHHGLDRGHPLEEEVRLDAMTAIDHFAVRRDRDRVELLARLDEHCKPHDVVVIQLRTNEDVGQ